MSNFPVQPPFSNVQAELLKLFSTGIPDSQLLALKNVMAKFLLKEGRDKADVIGDEKGYTNEKLKQMLNKQ